MGGGCKMEAEESSLFLLHALRILIKHGELHTSTLAQTNVYAHTHTPHTLMALRCR